MSAIALRIADGFQMKKQTVLWLECFLLLIVQIHGQGLKISPGAIERAQIIYSVQFPSEKEIFEAPAEGSTSPIKVKFTVPSKDPSFLLFESYAARPGRIVVHLGVKKIPEILANKAPENDWANRTKRFDFRAVIDLNPCKWQYHALNFNQEFFEAITKQKLPYDLSGADITTLGIEISQPAETGQKVEIRDIRVLSLTHDALITDLKEKLDRLQNRLGTFSPDSEVYRYWKTPLQDVGARIRNFGNQERNVQEWNKLADQLEQFELVSRKWTLAGQCESGYCLGTETSLKRISGRHNLFTFSGDLSRYIEIETAGNEFESFQLVLIPVTVDLDQVTFKVENLHSKDRKKKGPEKERDRKRKGQSFQRHG